ncbi:MULTISPECIES: SDR family oxidoreductase [unclassified Streptomyces]|uniref:SDR family oxidoreductase n=1 Tax=unclassified Streptomyces TaxID=2593676 RepID=UPI000DB906A7|nr:MULTISPECIES: SDR family oxidoreductase [unclassified Streptomyces]MYT68436.1 NAD(P)H-binding protein [Streptomyces sp. SID8367]RAJ86109.1 NAD(P)H dehydrogenase (quinone) [Streptomyces sp. PsTaAH-137]
MSLVVTGATGHLGRLVVEGLLAAGVPAGDIAAVVRSQEKGAELATRGVELRIADYSAPATLKDAFRAGDRVVFVSGSEVGQRVAQHRAVIDAAKEAGVALLAYTGVLGGPDADFALADEHKVTEQAILDSGLPYTFLRNGWYHENYTQNLAPVLEHGAVVASAGEGRVASASRADYAAAAVAVLTGEGHENRAYELSGDTAWSLVEYAAEVARQSGKDVVYRNVTPEQNREVLVGAGLPAPFADILVDVDAAIAKGLLARGDGDLARLIGRPTTPVADAIAEALK